MLNVGESALPIKMVKVNYSDWILALDAVWGDRWQRHRRLQELRIPGNCAIGQLSIVTVDTPTAAIQWSLARQSLAGRSQLVNWLDRCFALDPDRNGKLFYI